MKNFLQNDMKQKFVDTYVKLMSQINQSPFDEDYSSSIDMEDNRWFNNTIVFIATYMQVYFMIGSMTVQNKM